MPSTIEPEDPAAEPVSLLPSCSSLALGLDFQIMAAHDSVLNEGIDSKTFQLPLAKLAETLAYKAEREGGPLIKPAFVAFDIYVMVRQVLKIYEVFFYLNADVRKLDPAWHIGFPAAVLPLVRSMIDCLYNITTLLENPQINGRYFRASGYKQMLDAIAEDEKRYGGSKQWDDHNAERRTGVELDMRIHGFTAAEVSATPQWLTLGRYLMRNPTATNAVFLQQLTLGFWREYSGMSHAAFHGLIPTAPFFTPRDIPEALRPHFEIHASGMLSMHLLRVVGLLLCILTEIQAHFQFDGADINKRLVALWGAMSPALEIKQLYDSRYAQLMSDAGITS